MCRYEKNAALIFNDHDLKINETQKMYFMADNIDHNPANLVGRNTCALDGYDSSN